MPLSCCHFLRNPHNSHSIAQPWGWHYGNVIIGAVASQFTSLTIVYWTVYSGADQRKHQSSASLAFVRGIHRWPVNSPHKWPVMRKMMMTSSWDIGVFCEFKIWYCSAVAIAVHYVIFFLNTYITASQLRPSIFHQQFFFHLWKYGHLPLLQLGATKSRFHGKHTDSTFHVFTQQNGRFHISTNSL